MTYIFCMNCERDNEQPDKYGLMIDRVSQCDYCWGQFCDNCCMTHNDYGLVCCRCDHAIEDRYTNQQMSLREWAMQITPEELIAAEQRASKEWLEAEGIMNIQHVNAALDVFQDVIYKRGLGHLLNWR